MSSSSCPSSTSCSNDHCYLYQLTCLTSSHPYGSNSTSRKSAYAVPPHSHSLIQRLAYSLTGYNWLNQFCAERKRIMVDPKFNTSPCHTVNTELKHARCSDKRLFLVHSEPGGSGSQPNYCILSPASHGRRDVESSERSSKNNQVYRGKKRHLKNLEKKRFVYSKGKKASEMHDNRFHILRRQLQR